MSEQNDLRFERLGRVVQAGMFRFVLLWGTLGWGGSTGSLFWVAMYFLGWDLRRLTWAEFFRVLGGFAVAGTILALPVWLLLRWLYAHALKARTADRARTA